MTTLDRNARNEGDRFRTALTSTSASITESRLRGFLDTQTFLLTKPGVVPANGVGRETGGALFHMGQYSEAGTSNFAPGVQRFLSDASAPYRTVPRIYPVSVQAELERLRDLATRFQSPAPTRR